MARPAKHEQLDSGIAIGVPSYLPSSAASGRGLYFVFVHDASVVSGASNSGCTSFNAVERELPFEGLEMGTLLGAGGYGRVYRGTYQGQRCAVKARLCVLVAGCHGSSPQSVGIEFLHVDEYFCSSVPSMCQARMFSMQWSARGYRDLVRATVVMLCYQG